MTVQIEDKNIIAECNITYHGFKEYASRFLPCYPVLRQSVITHFLACYARDACSFSTSLQFSPFLVNHILDDLERVGYLHTYSYDGKRSIGHIFPALRHHAQNYPLPPRYQTPTVILGAGPYISLDIEARIIRA